MDWKKEPVMVFGAGGTALVQAVMQLLIAFGVPLTPEQQAAISVVAGIVLGFLARAHVTPTATVAADAVAAKAANRP